MPPWWASSPPSAAAPSAASPQRSSTAAIPAAAVDTQKPRPPTGTAAQRTPPPQPGGEGSPLRSAPAASATERGAAPATAASDAGPAPQGPAAAAETAAGRLDALSLVGPASASERRLSQPEGQSSRARQPPLDALHQPPPGAPALERKPADASATAATAAVAASAAQPGSGTAGTEPAATSAQPAGSAAAEQAPADDEGHCAASAAGIGASEQQRAADRSARRHIDAYPMDYYARDGGPWHRCLAVRSCYAKCVTAVLPRTILRPCMVRAWKLEHASPWCMLPKEQLP